jgi:hypothetical protein
LPPMVLPAPITVWLTCEEYNQLLRGELAPKN